MHHLRPVDSPSDDEEVIKIHVEPAAHHCPSGYVVQLHDIYAETAGSYISVAAAVLQIITELEAQGNAIDHFNVSSNIAGGRSGGVLMVAMVALDRNAG